MHNHLCLQALFALTLGGFGSASNNWDVKTVYTASNFSQHFGFDTSDPSGGFVQYQTQAAARAAGLFKDSNNVIYMGADTKNIAPSGRSSVRVTSVDSFPINTLLVMDANHAPWGVGTWPAFWTVGPNWPAGGEIDIVEQVNDAQQNDMTLHTSPGCTMPSGLQGLAGSQVSWNCGAGDNSGCGVTAAAGANTYGTGFNQNGGGTYAMAWTTDGIKVWFFPRGSAVSTQLSSSGSIDTSTWPTPQAYFSGTNCDMNKYFSAQQIVINVDFCGPWGGAGTPWASTGISGSCNNYVANNPGAFTQAYWEINYVKLYSMGSSLSSVTNGLTQPNIKAVVPAAAVAPAAPAAAPTTTAAPAIVAASSIVATSGFATSVVAAQNNVVAAQQPATTPKVMRLLADSGNGRDFFFQTKTRTRNWGS